MIGENYIQQNEYKIKNYIAEKNFEKAFETYKDLAQKFPYHKDLRYIKSEIEKSFEIENDKKIKLKLEEIKDEWKNNNYGNILKELKPFLDIAPNNKKLKKQYLKAAKLYKKEIENNQKEFRKKHEKVLNILIDGNVNEFLSELNSIETQYAGNQFVKDFIKEYKSKFIENKINKNTDLIYSNKFDVTEILIEKLKKVDKNNQKIKEIEKGVRLRRYQSQEYQQTESIYEGMKNVETLLKLKKYAKAYKASKELIKVAPKNEEIKKYLNIAYKKLKGTNLDQSTKIILNNQNKLIEDYIKNKSNYIKI